MMVGAAASAGADIVHTIKFTQDPVVIVWSGDTSAIRGQSVAVDRQADPAPPSYVGPGVLEPLAASFNPLSRSNQTSFRVASNAPFVIRAQVRHLPRSQDGKLALTLSDVGPNAKINRSDGITPDLLLSELETPQIIYRSNTRTAARPGSVASQSVAFVADWASAAGADVSITVSAE